MWSASASSALLSSSDSRRSVGSDADELSARGLVGPRARDPRGCARSPGRVRLKRLQRDAPAHPRVRVRRCERVAPHSQVPDRCRVRAREVDGSNQRRC